MMQNLLLFIFIFQFLTCFANAKIWNPPSYRISLEALYFKAIEDSVQYAEIVPQFPTDEPVIKSLEQEHSWDPGVRASFSFPLFYDKWQMEFDYTYFRSAPDRLKKSDSSHSIFASLVIPIIGINGNVFANKVEGEWRLNMNIVDWLIKRPIYFSKNFEIRPAAGLRACFIDQMIDVDYEDFRIDFPRDNTPQKVIGKSSVWGVGPSIGIEMDYFLPKHFSMFLNGFFSCEFGNFDLKTIYKKLLHAPEEAKIVIKDDKQRVFSNVQMQIGFLKEWNFGKHRSFELDAGWEMQIWWRQMRMNWFSTIPGPPEGGDLTLSGPFLKAMFCF
jgi:hypothetical protein